MKRSLHPEIQVMANDIALFGSLLEKKEYARFNDCWSYN